MKLFQQLLVAPAALGLLAPVAASAAELNLDGVNKYATEESVTSVSQLTDVKPTDWAYQALSNLIENYGCVAGYPGGTYKGGRAMTRFEAAALLNACLDRVSEVTDELKKLMAEFEKELAVLKGRVDGLEAKVGVLEAQQFSTTTKLKGIATMVVGGTTYGGSAVNQRTNTANLNNGGTFAGQGARALPNAMAFNYDVRLNLDTSFTGKDLLRTTLRAGTANGSAFYAGRFGGSVTPGTALETFFQEETANNNTVGINRLFYQFPIGSEFTATFGGRVRQDDMLAMWPSVYPADTVLDFFTYAGSPSTYNLALGAGAGLWWQRGGFSISTNYVSQNGSNADPNDANGNAGGIGNTASQSSATVQVGYAGNNWGLAAAYNYAQNLVAPQGTNFYTGLMAAGQAAGSPTSTNSFALSGYWQPAQSGWIPSISAGWGIATTGLLNGFGGGTAAGAANGYFTTASWSVGLQWSDAFVKGNALGMGFGQNTMVTKMSPNLQGGAAGQGYAAPVDGNWAWEWWYKFQVTDNISVTPAIFYLSQPSGQAATSQANGGYGTFSSFGYLVKTTFKF